MNNEAAIAERLRQSVPVTPPPATTAPVAPATDEDRGFVSDMGDYTNIYRLYDYFNVEPSFRNGENEHRLEVIYRWAADKAQSTDYLAIANVLTAYGQGMGAGSLEKSGLNRMYEFIQLDQHIKRLQEAQGSL